METKIIKYAKDEFISVTGTQNSQRAMEKSVGSLEVLTKSLLTGMQE